MRHGTFTRKEMSDIMEIERTTMNRCLRDLQYEGVRVVGMRQKQKVWGYGQG